MQFLCICYLELVNLLLVERNELLVKLLIVNIFFYF